MESDPDLLESFASADAASAAAAVREIIPEALASTHMRLAPAAAAAAATAAERSVHGTARDTPGTRSAQRANSDGFGSALLPGRSSMSPPADLRQALALPLDKLGMRASADGSGGGSRSGPPPSVGSKRSRSGGCVGCMSLSAEMAYLTRLRRTERMQRLGGGFFSDLPEGLQWVVATVAPGEVPWLEGLISATPRVAAGCGARLWQACSGQRPSPPQAMAPQLAERSNHSGTSSDGAAAASDIAPLPPIEERYHYRYAVAAAGGRAARGGLFAGMLGKCGLQTLSWDTETQGSTGGGRSRMGGRVGIGSQEVLTFRSTTESTSSGNSTGVGVGGAAVPATPAGPPFALRDVRIQE